MWNKLGDKFFLMPDPRKVPFTTEFFGIMEGGTAWVSTSMVVTRETTILR